MKRLINPLLLVMLLVLSCKEEKQVVRHQCNWEDCELVGQTSFHSTWGYEPYTDGWCVEKCHWEYPDWDYSLCENWSYYDSVIHPKTCQCDMCLEWTDGHTRDYTLIDDEGIVTILDQSKDTITILNFNKQ